MRCCLIVICCVMLVPGITYAQTAESDVGTMKLDQEQYILERTGDVLVKISGNVELDWNPPKVLLTHTTPSGESVTHNIMTNGTGYFDFYFVHDWHSIRGNYDIFVSTSNHPYTTHIPIGTISYELIRDPSYKSDQQIKEDYWMNTENRTERMSTVEDALYLYERNWNEEPLWVKNIFDWYYMNQITEKEVISIIQYLVKNNILKLD